MQASRARLPWILALAFALACGDDSDELEADATIPADSATAASDATPDAATAIDFDGGPLDAQVEASTPSDSGASMDATAPVDTGPPPLPVSEYCGDAIRDPVLEECDDGPGDPRDSCSEQCIARSLGVVPSDDVDDAGPSDEPERWLGFGRHPVAASENRIGVVHLRDAIVPEVWLQRFDAFGAPIGEPQPMDADTVPTLQADPVVAALPQDALVVAFTERSEGTPDVALRRVDADGVLGPLRHAHDQLPGPQSEADLLWAGDSLLVAYSDDDNIMLRHFDAQLEPLGPSQPLAATAAIEAGAALAPFAGSWAAAWRVGDAGSERIRVKAGAVEWPPCCRAPGSWGFGASAV
ncbi:MAG: hypothetical protein OEZ06_29530 [Myxococcales bacterium]|nr:hypothetical protein [Myxococcales bacterium]